MTREAMERSRHREDPTHRRHTESHSHQTSVRKIHNVKSSVHQHHQSGKDRSKPSHHGRENRQVSYDRRDWRSRNSPIELVARGNRTTNSCSSEESTTRNTHGSNHRHRKRGNEESLEELSRRKRRIESEINALDAEEAATSRGERRERSHNRNHNKMSRHDGRAVRVKEEVCSDDERSHRNSRRHRSNSGGENSEWGRPREEKPKVAKEKPNFETSGKLAEDTNTYNGVVIKYNEPKEARKPKRKWRLYPFKGSSPLAFIPVHRQSAYLLGRTRLIADIPIDHPSCSKQHAVLQFRVLPYKREDGSTGRSVRPYIIDLDSANGTYVNNKRIDPRRYVELLEQDVLKFGYSSREYVILHEDSKFDDNVDSS